MLYSVIFNRTIGRHVVTVFITNQTTGRHGDCIYHQSDHWQAWWLYSSPIRPLAGMVTVFITNQTTGRHGDCIHHQSDHWQAWWMYSSPIRPLAGMLLYITSYIIGRHVLTVFITNQTIGRYMELYSLSIRPLTGMWLYLSPLRSLAGMR